MSLSFDISGFHALYSIIAVIMWAGAALFSLEYLLKTEAHDLQANRRRQKPGSLALPGIVLLSSSVFIHKIFPVLNPCIS